VEVVAVMIVVMIGQIFIPVPQKQFVQMVRIMIVTLLEIVQIEIATVVNIVSAR
jgi:hypothetical protein